MWSHVPNKRRLWNVSSPKMCFRRFWAFDLTLSATGRLRTLSLYTNRFVSWRAVRSFLPQSSSSIRGKTDTGVCTNPLPTVPVKMTKMILPLRVSRNKAGVDSGVGVGVGVDSGGSESESESESPGKSSTPQPWFKVKIRSQRSPYIKHKYQRCGTCFVGYFTLRIQWWWSSCNLSPFGWA